MKAALGKYHVLAYIFGVSEKFSSAKKKIFKFWEAKEIIFSSRKCEGGFSGVSSGAGKVLIPPSEPAVACFAFSSRRRLVGRSWSARSLVSSTTLFIYIFLLLAASFLDVFSRKIYTLRAEKYSTPKGEAKEKIPGTLRAQQLTNMRFWCEENGGKFIKYDFDEAISKLKRNFEGSILHWRVSVSVIW